MGTDDSSSSPPSSSAIHQININPHVPNDQMNPKAQEDEKKSVTSFSSSPLLSSPSVSPSPPPSSFPSHSPSVILGLPNPEDTANIFSITFFSWLTPIMSLGKRRPLQESDLFLVRKTVDSEYLSALFTHHWEVEIHKGKNDSAHRPSLGRALYECFKTEFWVAAVLKILNDALTFLEPTLLSWVIIFIQNQQTDQPDPQWHGWALSASMLVVPILCSICTNSYFRITMTIGLKMRAVLITQIYQKSLKLSPKAKSKLDTGKTINMMSTDASKVDLFMGYAHYLWTTLLQIGAAIGLLIATLGWQAIVGICVMFIIIPFQNKVMKMLQKVRKDTVKYTDQRVKIMNELLQGMKVVKLYAWEKSFLSRLNSIRLNEMKFVQRGSFVRAYNMFVMSAGPILMSLLAFVTLAATGGTLQPQDVFAAVVLFSLLRFPLLLWPATVGYYSDAKVAVQRIEEFLLAEELKSQPTLADHPQHAVIIDNATFSWESESEREEKEKGKGGKEGEGKQNSPSSSLPVLSNVNLTIPHGSLTIVVGAVGSAKTSLLCGIIGELSRLSGQVTLCGTVGYCSQTAWIENATVRENILFGLPYDEKKYQKCLSVCALERDLEILPAGDMTEIGERGINLSGGQKQRVNLARVTYFNPDIILMDDCLSAVDSHVAAHLMDQCILGEIRTKTRILVTHALHLCFHADFVIFMKEGKIEEKGTFAELIKSNGEFAKLIAQYGMHQGEGEGESQGESTTDSIALSNGSSLSPSPLLRDVSKASTKKLLVSSSSVKSDISLVDSPEELQKLKDNMRKAAMNLIQTEERTTGSVSSEVYYYYFAAVGGFIIIFTVGFLNVISTANSIASNFWLAFWSNDSFSENNGFYIGIYTALSLSQCIVTLLAALATSYFCTKAAVHLHDKSFAGVLRAPMSFFDSTPIGRVINRFSRDQDIIDTIIGDTFRMFLVLWFSIVGTFIVIIVVNFYFIIALIPMMILYWWTQSFYRASSREIKRIDSVTRSPLFAHFSETLTGLPTIRAYRQQNVFIERNAHKLNSNNRAYYTQVLAQRWLAIRLESIGALIIFFTTLVMVIQSNSVNPSLAGLAISYSLTVVSALNFGVRQLVEVENNMNAVERSKFYTDHIPQERPDKIDEIDSALKEKKWPQSGQIVIKEFSLRYRENLPLVLKGINMTIQPGERIGIAGTTGSGKSTMILGLFRLVEAASGQIFIDGVDISTVGLDYLRSSMAIIPQDPLLWSGTLRLNLDPFNERSDDEIWSALRNSLLDEMVMRLPERLSAPVTEDGANFSVGQRCQICLARAMLRHAKILMLDEATASIDQKTDDAIQQSLRDHFECTILTIAHRLNTVVDYDRVVVFEVGKLIEFDTPATLLRNPQSKFYSFVEKTGRANAEVLRQQSFFAEKFKITHGTSIGLGKAYAKFSEKIHNLEENANGTDTLEGDNGNGNGNLFLNNTKESTPFSATIQMDKETQNQNQIDGTSHGNGNAHSHLPLHLHGSVVFSADQTDEIELSKVIFTEMEGEGEGDEEGEREGEEGQQLGE